MRRFNSIVLTAITALVLVFTGAGCGDDRTPEEKAADAAREKQEVVNEDQVDKLVILLDSGGWNEGEKTFTEGSGDNAVHFAIVSTGQVKCSPMFRLAGEDYVLAAVVHEMETKKSERLSVGGLPGAFQASGTNLSKGKFDKLVREHRGKNGSLRAKCADRK
jgi:hypothetical protein